MHSRTCWPALSKWMEFAARPTRALIEIHRHRLRLLLTLAEPRFRSKVGRRLCNPNVTFAHQFCGVAPDLTFLSSPQPTSSSNRPP